MDQFEFGFSREDITPTYGIPLCGYFNPRPNRGVLDRLAVKAAVFRTGKEYAAVVSFDLCLFGRSFVDELDSMLKQKKSPLYGRTLFCATHTHTGPYTSSVFCDAQDLDFLAQLKEKAIRALENATKALAPAELFAAETECHTLAFNRRFVMKNGTILTNPGKLNPEIERPEGGIDPKILMMQVRQHDRPVLLLANISNHADTVGGDYVSADWPGVMEKEIQKEAGYELPVMTITAPQGNINHFNVRTPGSQTSYEEAKRIGKGYAGEILAALYRMKKIESPGIRTVSGEFEAPYIRLTDEEYSNAKRIYEENKDAVMSEGRDFTSEDIARGVPFVKKFFAELAIQCRENPIRKKRMERQIRISFGKELAIVSFPAEPFIEIGQAVRRESPFPMTILAALGQGEIGYVGLPENYGKGGYETSPSREKADRTVGETMIRSALALLQ